MDKSKEANTHTRSDIKEFPEMVDEFRTKNVA